MTSVFLASLSLTLFALLAACLLKRFRIKSPLFHRITWGLVLLQGVAFVGIPLQLPVLDNSPGTAFGYHSTNASTLEEGVPINPEFAQNTPGVLNGNAPAKGSINLLPVLYSAGLTIGLMYFLVAYLALLISLKKASPACAAWRTQLDQLLHSRTIDPRSVSLRSHPRMGPLLCRIPSGYTIVLPENEWNDLSPEQREAVLIHEIAHIERRDIWKTLAMRLIALIHWFNPTAWWSARQFEEAAEWECDRRLSTRGTSYAVHYVKALLAFAEPKSQPPVGASLARGAALSPRIDRLTSGDRIESRRKCCLFAMLIFACAAVALLRFELVAQDDDEDRDERSDHAAFVEVLNQYIKRFSGSGEVLAQFTSALQSKPGQIVMKDLAEAASDEVRERKIETAFPDHIDRFYQTQDGKLSLKSGHSDMKEKFLKTSQTWQKDITDIRIAMGELRESLAKQSEAGELMARFLDQENAANWIYIEEIRERMNPANELIRDRLGSVLSPGNNGLFTVLESRKARVQSMMKMANKVQRIADKLRDELPAFADEIATPDETHRNYKELMSQPGFADYLAVELQEDIGDRPASRAVAHVFDHLEGGFLDKGDGLHINPEEQDEMAEVFTHYQLISRNLSPISEALETYRSKIDTPDELHQTFKEGLGTSAAVMLFAMEIEGEGGENAGYVFNALVGEFLESDKKGKKKIRKDGQEEVADVMRGALRDLRQLSRRNRQLADEVSNFEDPALEEFYQSSIGKLIVLQMIREEIERLNPDGLAIWFGEHFEADESGKLRPKAGSMELLSEVVEQTKEISASLKSDF